MSFLLLIKIKLTTRAKTTQTGLNVPAVV